jgi:quercetin dioxygenase-like cupin family protein
MRSALCFAISLSGFAALIGFSGLASAADPLQIDPGHHRLEFENAQFRVDRGFFGPGESSPDFFDAEGVVIVALTPMRMRLHFPDGKFADPPPAPAGVAFWAPAGKIRPENLLDQRTEFVIVIPRSGDGARKGADPLAADPDHYALQFENEQVRVLRARMEPHGKSVMHGHPAHVAVLLTGGKTRMHLPGGNSFLSSRKAGDVVSAPAGEHMPENLLDESTEVIVIEPK